MLNCFLYAFPDPDIQAVYVKRLAPLPLVWRLRAVQIARHFKSLALV